MKKLALLLTLVATVTLTSCGLMNGSSTSATSTAAQQGQACSNALVGLYNSNKTNGTIAITNPTDLMNMVALIGTYNDLKSHKDDATYKADFAKGMASAGTSLITTENATSLMNAMLNSTGIASNINTASVQEKAQTVAAILTLVKMLK